MNNKQGDFTKALKDTLKDTNTLKEDDEVIVCIIQFNEKENRYQIDTHVNRK